MDNALFAFLIAIFLGSLPSITLGFLIAYKKKYSLLSGWDASRFSDPAAVGRVAGKSLILMGVLIFVVTGLWWKQIMNDLHMTFTIIPVVLIPFMAILYAGKKYGKRDL